MGFDLSGDSLRGRNHSASGGCGNQALNCGGDYADLGLVARLSADAATMVCGIGVGSLLLSNRSRDAALGGAICGVWVGGAADCDRTNVYSGAGRDDGTAKDQPA